jgi:hypothetical protein
LLISYAGLQILPVTAEFVFRRSRPGIPSEAGSPIPIFSPDSSVAIFREGEAKKSFKQLELGLLRKETKAERVARKQRESIPLERKLALSTSIPR